MCLPMHSVRLAGSISGLTVGKWCVMCLCLAAATCSSHQIAIALISCVYEKSQIVTFPKSEICTIDIADWNYTLFLMETLYRGLSVTLGALESLTQVNKTSQLSGSTVFLTCAFPVLNKTPSLLAQSSVT